MSTKRQAGSRVEAHLHAALEAAENDEARFYLREALQKIYLETH